MENYERFEQLLLHRSFKELNEEEKLLVKNFVGSEEEYESLRRADQRLISYFNKQNRISPSPRIWKRIVNTWGESSSPMQRNFWLKIPIPAYATLLMLFAVGILSWYGGVNYSRDNKVYVDHGKLHVDTVFIRSKPDTVVRERIIYIERAQTVQTLQVSNESLPEHPVNKGINMKEKEELEKLLVSGSM